MLSFSLEPSCPLTSSLQGFRLFPDRDPGSPSSQHAFPILPGRAFRDSPGDCLQAIFHPGACEKDSLCSHYKAREKGCFDHIKTSALPWPGRSRLCLSEISFMQKRERGQPAGSGQTTASLAWKAATGGRQNGAELSQPC